MVTNEVVNDMVSNKRAEILCKRDMKKAFDNVFWDFVDYMLERLGLGRNGGNGSESVFPPAALRFW